MIWTDKAPEFGDIVRIKVKFYYHYGIFIDEGDIIQFGLPDNEGTHPDEISVISTDISTFSMGGFIECGLPDREEKKRRHSPEKTVELATSRLGERGYNILNNNCEHFANECYFGEKKSFLDDVRAKIRQKINTK